MFCLHTTCVPGAWRGQKRTLDWMELELAQLWVVRQILRIKPGPLQEQPVLLTTEPSLQPLNASSFKDFGFIDLRKVLYANSK